MYNYTLTVGLPHTNHNGLAEHLLLMHAGHFQWTSIAQAIGKPLSTLRTTEGDKVYATFYYIEERFPSQSLLSAFKLDDCLRMRVFLRAFKNIAVEGHVLFDHEPALSHAPDADSQFPSEEELDRHPHIRFGNIFISPVKDNSSLRVAPPANADFSGILPLPNSVNPYQITKEAEVNGTLGLLDPRWTCLDVQTGFDVQYRVDPDRDSNGAGLVYFANYVAFMDAAERVCMQSNSRRVFSQKEIFSRTVKARRVAYYGNAALDSDLRIGVSLFSPTEDDRQIGLRYAIHRCDDNKLICLSEAIKIFA
ncbi:MAG: hypothetical protein FJ245_09830 [Nitrospira sp.]|nr:hypothetical protein [Nitrospira sp.]